MEKVKGNQKRKITSIIVAFVMMFTGIMIVGPMATDKTYASTNGHTQSEAVAWAKARADEHYEINDGSGWTQCTEFVWAYYEYLIGRHVNGNAYQYLTDEFGACPSGWTRPETTNVQPGDIVIWDQYASFNAANSDYTFEYGHIGVVVEVNGNNMTTVEANAYGAPRGRTEYRYDREVSYIDGLIRPDFAPEIIPIDKATVTVPDATYTGKKLTPEPVVTYGGQTLVKGTDYKCLYKNNKDIGLATVTITGIGNCKGSIKANFKIIPKGVSISKVTATDTTLLVVWKPQLSKPAINGYQIGYSNSSDMNNQKVVSVSNRTTPSKMISNLDGNTTYYIQLRTYKKVGKSNYYSKWSSIKKITTKAPFATADGEVYYDCVKCGDYVYCNAGYTLYKVNVKNNKKSVFAKDTEKRIVALTNFSIKNGYLYCIAAGDGWDKCLYRISLKTGEMKIIFDNTDPDGIYMSYMIAGNRIYFENNINSYSMDLEGGDKKIDHTYDGDYGVDVTKKKSNVSGYRMKITNSSKYGGWGGKYYLVKSNGKTVFLREGFCNCM